MKYVQPITVKNNVKKYPILSLNNNKHQYNNYTNKNI